MRGIIALATVVLIAALGGVLRPGLSAQDMPPVRSVWNGVYTDEQSARGEALYRQECASCHAEGGSGGEMAPPLSGGAFTSNWNGLTIGDLFERIRVTMPDDTRKLSRAQDADVVAYMLSLNKFPAGKTPLNRETEILKQIRFEATRPQP